MHAQVGDGGDRIERAVVETAGQADDVAGQDDVEDLPLAVAQQLVAHGVAFFDEAKLAVFVAVDHEVAPPADHDLAVDDGVERFEVGGRERDVLHDPHHEGVPVKIVAGYGGVHVY